MYVCPWWWWWWWWNLSHTHPQVVEGTGDDPVPALRGPAGRLSPVLQQLVTLLLPPQLQLCIRLVVQNLQQEKHTTLIIIEPQPPKIPGEKI